MNLAELNEDRFWLCGFAANICRQLLCTHFPEGTSHLASGGRGIGWGRLALLLGTGCFNSTELVRVSLGPLGHSQQLFLSVPNSLQLLRRSFGCAEVLAVHGLSNS